MSDEYYNHDGEGSGFFSLILLAVFLLGGFVVARVYEPSQAIGADAAKARLAKREKIDTAGADKVAGYAVVSKDKGVISLPIGTALAKVAKLGSEGTRAALVERSIAKDGKYEAPKPVDVSGYKRADDATGAQLSVNGQDVDTTVATDGTTITIVNLADPALIAKGKVLFMTKTCFLCHQTDPAIPAALGLAIKAPQFIGDFWGKEREVHIGFLPELAFEAPIQKVVFNEEYFIESVNLPYEKVLKGVLSPMVLAPGLVNNEEVLALMAYVKSLSK